MRIVSLIKNVKSIVVTPATNLDYNTKEILDYGELNEMEIGGGKTLQMFNSKTQVIEQVSLNKIKDYHWFIDDTGVIHKVIHIL